MDSCFWANILRGLFASMGQLISPPWRRFRPSTIVKAVELSSKAVRMQGLLISVPVWRVVRSCRPALNWCLAPSSHSSPPSPGCSRAARH